MVFLAAVWALGARRWGETSKEHRDFVYMMLGLLGFALVACLVRTGAYALRLDAPLYGLPVMLVAIACVHTARRLVGRRTRHPAPRLASIRRLRTVGAGFRPGSGQPAGRFAGLLCEHAWRSRILGLGLYVASLRIDRHPAFLYLAFGAVVAGRLGAHYFLAGRLHVIEEAVRQLLGYPHHLPIPFRAILGVIPNAALAGLSLWFVKHWDDRRLARHCHYIGLPLSIAACIWSGFEPLAAVICLSALRDLVPAGGLDLRRSVGDVPGGRRAGRRLLFRNDAGAGHHAGRSGPGGGRAWFCLLGRSRRTAPPACGTGVSRSLAPGRTGSDADWR